jgi:hypothetical protein
LPIFDESDGLVFRVELWTPDEHIERLLARCSSVTVARGALEAAIAEFPDRVTHCEIARR